MKNSIEKLRGLLKSLSGSQRKPQEGIATISEGIDKGVMIEKPKQAEVKGPESIPAPVNDGGMPESLKGLSYSEIELLEADGELSWPEQVFFHSLKGPSGRRGRMPNLKLILERNRNNGK